MELEEKRRFPRMPLRIPLHYQVRGTSKFNNSISNDISSGGLGFTNNEFIAPNTALMLELDILSRALRPIGRVAWSSPLSHSDKYQLGVEFLELDPKEKNYLSDYIDMKTTGFSGLTT
jgi:hypothetical protein